MLLQSTHEQGVALSNRQIAIIIPARQPSALLLPLLQELSQHAFGAIVLINDGSDESSHSLFAQAQQVQGVHLLTHAINLGKGRALKTAFNYVLTALPQIEAVVTADADGQHRPEDIAKVATALQQQSDHMVLGVRAFSGDVPLRSRFGNGLTKKIFSFTTGVFISDTQTGLRGFPRSFLPALMALDGERYEYEMTVLAHVCRNGARPVQVPIATVYIDGNSSSHFNPIWDSMRIYFVLVRFYASSLLAAGIDLAGFSLTFIATGSILVSLLVGRLSSLVNFALNRRYVFHNRGSIAAALWRYYALVLLITGLSYGMIRLLTQHAHWNVYATKIGVDIVLSLVSFSVQRALVFRRGEKL